MPDPQTTNCFLNIPVTGTDVGTWGTSLNTNFSALDGILGGQATVAVGNANITLSSGQYQNNLIFFTGSPQTGDVTITFPAVSRFYLVMNTTNSAFLIKLKTGAGNQICAPPQDMVWIQTTATDVRYANLARIGSYWDYAGSAVPSWVSNCTVPPYLNCDGSAFNAATYPALNTILGGNTLPDLRGRFRATLNQGTGRLTGFGLDGNTLLAQGGSQSHTVSVAELPAHNHTITDPGHNHSVTQNAAVNSNVGSGSLAPFVALASPATITINNNTTGITIDNAGGGGAMSIVPPATVGGLTLVRAA